MWKWFEVDRIQTFFGCSSLGDNLLPALRGEHISEKRTQFLKELGQAWNIWASKAKQSHANTIAHMF